VADVVLGGVFGAARIEQVPQAMFHRPSRIAPFFTM
jgi:hypothetical protein